MPLNRNPHSLEMCLWCRARLKLNNVDAFTVPKLVLSLRTCRESPHHEASPGGVSKFATDFLFMGEDGTPLTIPAGCDGLTKAFFSNVVFCKGTSHGYAERALAHNLLSTGHQKVILQSDQESSIIDVRHKAVTLIPTEIVYEESPVGDRNANRQH